jgi:alpha-mannosidase
VAQNLGEVRETCDDSIERSLQTITNNIDTSADSNGALFIVFNPNGFAVTQPFSIAADSGDYILSDNQGGMVSVQYSEAEKNLYFIAQDVPAWGWRTYYLSVGEPGDESDYAADSAHLENKHIKVALDESGYVVSIFNKDLNYEFIADGARANLLQYYADHPLHYDSWDLGYDKYTQEAVNIEDTQSIDLVESGPVRQVIEVSRKGEVEAYVQRIILYAGADYVDFETRVLNWGDPPHRLLKASFPTSIVNERKEITNNIPYGHLTRVLDGSRADWEFVGHKWIDIKETHTSGEDASVGMALISKEKYGYDVANDGPGDGLSDGKCNILRLTLLKSGTSPSCKLIDSGGPVTDRGDFSAYYRVYPHAGDVRTADLYMHGEMLANPMLAHKTTIHAGMFKPSDSILQIENSGGVVVPTTLKRPLKNAENRELVLRLVEIDGNDTHAVFNGWPFDIYSAVQTDILERPLGSDLSNGESGFRLRVGHDAVETYRLISGEAASDDTQDDDGDADTDDDAASDNDDDDDDGSCCG